MRVGLLADSHDRLPAIAEFVKQMQAVGVSMVLHAGERHARLLDRIEREWRAVVSTVEEHGHSSRLHLLHELGDRRQAIVGVRQESNAHQPCLHSGSACSRRTRSSYRSRAVTTA